MLTTLRNNWSYSLTNCCTNFLISKGFRFAIKYAEPSSLSHLTLPKELEDSL